MGAFYRWKRILVCFFVRAVCLSGVLRMCSAWQGGRDAHWYLLVEVQGGYPGLRADSCSCYSYQGPYCYSRSADTSLRAFFQPNFELCCAQFRHQKNLFVVFLHGNQRQIFFLNLMQSNFDFFQVLSVNCFPLFPGSVMSVGCSHESFKKKA